MAEAPKVPFSNIFSGGLGLGANSTVNAAKEAFSNILTGGLGSKSVRELAQVLQGEQEKTTKNKALAPATARPGIGVTNSSAKEAVDKRLSTGIASPLLEGTVALPTTLNRTYWGLNVATAVDGLFTFEYKSLMSVGMLDSNGVVVDFFYEDDPPV